MMYRARNVLSRISGLAQRRSLDHVANGSPAECVQAIAELEVETNETNSEADDLCLARIG